MQAVNPTNIAKMTGNGNVEENGLYVLLISRQEEIIGLVKPLLPKPTMKPCVNTHYHNFISKSYNYMCI